MGRGAKGQQWPWQLARQHAGGGPSLLAAAQRRHGAALRAWGHALRTATARSSASGHTGPTARPARDTTRDWSHQARGKDLYHHFSRKPFTVWHRPPPSLSTTTGLMLPAFNGSVKTTLYSCNKVQIGTSYIRKLPIVITTYTRKLK